VTELFREAFRAENVRHEMFIMPFIVGLTGGIGSGKSTAAALFEALGAAVVDTDAISHGLTAPGGSAIPAILEAFGPEVVRPDGGLDRHRMRETVFANSAARKGLEGILHPLIRREAEQEAIAATAPYVVLVVPLLLENGSYRALVQRVLVVDCDPEIQAARVMARSGLARDAVVAIMRAQLGREQRLAGADDVIDNSTDAAALQPQVERLHARYLGLAGAAKKP
jgi:dephospho-CoA kinase